MASIDAGTLLACLTPDTSRGSGRYQKMSAPQAKCRPSPSLLRFLGNGRALVDVDHHTEASRLPHPLAASGDAGQHPNGVGLDLQRVRHVTVEVAIEGQPTMPTPAIHRVRIGESIQPSAT